MSISTGQVHWDINADLPFLDKVVVAGTGAQTNNYVHDDAAAIAMRQSGTAEWFGIDMIGSVTDVYYDDPATTGTTKGVRARAFDYKPFGDTRTAIGAPTATAAYVPDTRFTGMIRDDATQYTIGVRTYQPQLGRFNQQDPIIRTRGKLQSQYTYVRNRPTVLTDPSGMTEQGAWGTVGDFFEQALGFADPSEAGNWTSFGTDTALCAGTDVFSMAYSGLQMSPVGMFLPNFDSRTWATQHMGMNPCSAECATGDNLTAAAFLVVPIAGEAGLEARLLGFLGKTARAATFADDVARAANFADDAVRTGAFADDAARAAGFADDAVRAGPFADDAGRLGSAATSTEDVGLSMRGVRPSPGTRTRPEGIPDTWRIVGTDSPGGTRYYDPTNPGNSVRVMQGNPSSPFAASRSPYVRWQRDGYPLNVDGNKLNSAKDPAAHIPLGDFRFLLEAFQ